MSYQNTVAERPMEEETLSGSVERVTFHSEDNGFCVLKVKVKNKGTVTVVGSIPSISKGEEINITGSWKNDLKHGLQFKASSIFSTPPKTENGMVKYLSSMIKGVGDSFARKLVKEYGTEVFEGVEKQPERLLNIKGLGKAKREKIIEALKTDIHVKEFSVFLLSHGVSSSRTVEIYKKYGIDSINIIKENPYRLAEDFHGIGFVTADSLAQKIGFDKTSMKRLKAGVNYVLRGLVDSGHCGYPRNKLVEKAAEILEVQSDLVDQAVSEEISRKRIMPDTIRGIPCLFLRRYYQAEQDIALELIGLTQGNLPWGKINTDAEIAKVEKLLKINLADSQKDAIKNSLLSKVSVITGGPGVGKTTIVNSILKIIESKDMNVLLAAPTGRASKRMTETTGLEAKTIHRLLEYNPADKKFKRNETNPLGCDVLIVDEMSMVDTDIMVSLLKATPHKAAVIFVGDVNQLPSVGAGNVLNDIIESGAIKVTRLTEIFRQAKQSKIISNAHLINNGQMPELMNDVNGDFFFVSAETPEDCVRKIIKMVTENAPRRWGFDPIKDIQILSPMNRGGAGAGSLNVELQQILNGKATQKISKFGNTYAVGDKVMQIKNNYDKDVFNGDVGYVNYIDSVEGEVIVSFDHRNVQYKLDELSELTLAYACTIHKSQGSEYPLVIIPLLTQHYVMLQRNLIYTGVTRGKKIVVVVGQEKALSMAVRGVNQEERYTKLKEWIRKYK